MDSHPVTYDELIDYVLETLDETRRAHVTEHIGKCPQCAATITRFHAFRLFVRQTYANPPAESIHKANQLFEQAPMPRSPGRNLRQAYD